MRKTKRLRKKRNHTCKIGGTSNTQVSDASNNVVANASNNEVDASNNVVVEAKVREGVIDKLGNTLELTTANMLDRVNKVLESNQPDDKGLEEVVQDTVSILNKHVSNFNNTMDDPVAKEELKKTIENASEIADVIAQSAEKPLSRLIKVSFASSLDALRASISGAIKVLTDAMAAIPGVGAIIEIGKIANDSSKAVSAVVEAGSDITEATSDAIMETKDNYEQLMKEQEEKLNSIQRVVGVGGGYYSRGGAVKQYKTIHKQINAAKQRTLKSIQDFVHQNKTTRKNKEKHVHFAV
jgi:hypothetical protein